MRIKSIHLKNGYKRFHDLKIDLGDDPKRIIALVGPNGCGKSSVFDGILFFNYSVNGIVGNMGQKDFKYHSMNQMNDSVSKHNVAVEFVEGNYIDLFKKKQESQNHNTIFSLRSSYRYNNNLKVTQSKATTQIKLNNYGASTLSDLDVKMEENYRRLYIKYNNYLHKVDCKPSEAKSAIIGDLNKSLEKCLNLRISSIGNIEDNKGTLFFEKDDHPSEFEFNVLSSGEKQVVDLILDLYMRQEEYNDSIFIIDEPELHINTSVQRNLLMEINKLIGKNCQIWIATHSIGFLRALQEDLKNECDIIQFDSTKKWACDNLILTPMKKSVNNWKKIFETALDDLTGLVSPKTLIYCEGRDKPGISGQEKGFDAKVFNNIFGEKYHDTLFVSSGGNTELDQRSQVALSILTKVFSDIEILVVKDRDMASGKETDESDRLQYLDNNPKNHRVLKRWEIENYLFDKEVLMKYCTSYGCSFDQDLYEKTVEDVNNQDLKEITNSIRKICNIKGSINHEKFKLNLSELISEDMDVFKELEDVIFNRL